MDAIWKESVALFLQLIEFNPVDVHFHGQLLWVGLAHPCTLNLHVDEQVVGRAEGVLTLVGRLDAWIRERCAAIDGEHQRVGQYLHGISVVAITVDTECGAVGGVWSFFST